MNPETKGFPKSKERRYDLDWLRVLLFGLLIYYHYELLAEPVLDFRGEGAKKVFFILSEWRLAALFMISGMGTSFAFRKRSWKAYLTERSRRLLIPFFFGIFFFQTLLHPEILRTTFSLPPLAARTGPLWFILSLFLYSLLFTPLFIYLRRRPDNWFIRLFRAMLSSPLLSLLLPALLLMLSGIVPLTEWFGSKSFFWYALLFAGAYMLILEKELYYSMLERLRWPVSLLLPLLVMLMLYFKSHESESFVLLPFLASNFCRALHTWSWCLFVFSWGAKLLNHQSNTLHYLNRSIYPVYIIHMYLNYGILYYLNRLGLNTGLSDYVIGPLLVFIGSLMVFEVMKRGRLTSIVFGIKALPQNSDGKTGFNSLSSLSAMRTCSWQLTEAVTLTALVLLVVLVYHFKSFFFGMIAGF